MIDFYFYSTHALFARVNTGHLFPYADPADLREQVDSPVLDAEGRKELFLSGGERWLMSYS